MLNRCQKNKGAALILVIVFSAIASMLVAGILNMSLVQHKLLKLKLEKSKAFAFAEAGLEYYEWFMSRFPNDTTDGTGGPGPYVHDIKNSSGETIGRFSLSINANKACGVLQSADIESEAYSMAKPNVKRRVSARIMRPSVTQYSYVINADVWAGSSRDITGPYHSNGGIRMDGTNNSLVSSAKSSWYCTESFGCSPPQWKDGVFGSGPNSNLWKYPTEEIDFSLMSYDFGDLKNYAQNEGGIYLESFTGSSGDDSRGYQLIFKSDGTVDVYKVTYSYGYWGYREEYGYEYSYWPWYGWRLERNAIASKSFVGNYSIPPSCSLIFSEEKLWVEGTIDGKVAVFAARASGSYEPEIVLSGNINYKDSDGSDGILLFAQSYIIIPEYSPNNMELNGIFVSQSGSFGRSYYSYNTRNSLSINGTVVSNERVGTSWGCPDYFCSGYANRINSYDRYLRDDPPPFTPSSTSTLQYIKWREY